MQIPRKYVEDYSKALNVVSERAREQLVDALSEVDYTANVAEIRNAVIAIMQRYCGAATAMAARLATEFYNGLRLLFGINDGFKAEAETMREPIATENAVRAFAQDLVEVKLVEQFVGKCVRRIDYEIRLAANECVAYNARRDPRKPRWARVPTGVETCAFCIMLAGRGFDYHSEETASHSHDDCDCRIVPSWDKSPSVQGYNSKDYKAKYDEARKAWANGDYSDELKERMARNKKSKGRKYNQTNEILAVMREKYKDEGITR